MPMSEGAKERILQKQKKEEIVAEERLPDYRRIFLE